MRALDFLFFCRPLLLIPVWTVFLLFYDIDYPLRAFPTFQLMNLIFFSGLTSAAYIINQIYDRESDKINEKLGFFDRPVSFSVTGAWMMYSILLLSAFVFAFKHNSLFAPYGASVLAGILYSAPVFRRKGGKDRPFAGLILNAVPYSVFVWWALSAGGSETFVVFAQIETSAALALGSLILALAGVYLVTIVPDLVGDRKTGKQTIAVRYGSKKALFGATGFLLGALVSGVLADIPALYLTAALATALVALALRTGKRSHILLAAKAPILALSVFECYHHPLYGVFLLALFALTRVYYRRRFGIVYPKLA